MNQEFAKAAEQMAARRDFLPDANLPRTEMELILAFESPGFSIALR